jgi:outer membrane lipoprotein-sorting protein
VSTAAPSNATEGVAGDEGARILTKTAAKYAGIRTMTADFTMQTSNPLLRSKAESRGKLYQQRPDRIALRFTQPADAAIVGDGQFFYVYWPETSKDQATKTPASAGGAGSVDLQAQFVGDPVTRFRYTLQGQESVAGRATDVLMLIPRGQAPYRSLKVWVDREDALVRRFEFTESNGVERHINLSNVRTNVDIASGQFRFTAPAGVRVVGQ